MNHPAQPACARAERPRLSPPRRRRAALLPAFASLSLLVALAGCATSPDPRDGGFVSGVVGLSGGYQRRIDERRETLSAEQAAQRRLAVERQEVELERDAVRAELQRAEQKLAAQQRRIAAERARILALKQQSAAERARLAELKRAETRAGDAKRKLRAADVARDPLPSLQAKSRSIEQELREIDGMVTAVGGV